jgi:hypothetical protein
VRPQSDAAIDLYWLPLGAGGHSVGANGTVFEAAAAWLGRRDRCDLYHSALQVNVPEGRFVIEQAPAWGNASQRGVVAEGAVGARAARRFRLFRYEIRRWQDGVIPDIDEAVESPRRLSADPECARRLLALVPQVPTPVWGRDELGAGEMWNSNSTISWLVALSGLDVEAIRPPTGGRAPGWRAGIVIARRQHTPTVWPRIAQMGPSPRGGAYTYDWIENLLGLDMHRAERKMLRGIKQRAERLAAEGKEEARV